MIFIDVHWFCFIQSVHSGRIRGLMEAGSCLKGYNVQSLCVLGDSHVGCSPARHPLGKPNHSRYSRYAVNPESIGRFVLIEKELLLGKFTPESPHPQE